MRSISDRLSTGYYCSGAEGCPVIEPLTLIDGNDVTSVFALYDDLNEATSRGTTQEALLQPDMPVVILDEKNLLRAVDVLGERSVREPITDYLGREIVFLACAGSGIALATKDAPVSVCLPKEDISKLYSGLGLAPSLAETIIATSDSGQISCVAPWH